MEKASDSSEVGWVEIARRAKSRFRSQAITGLVVLVPAVVTFLVLHMVFQWLDGLAQPLIKRVLSRQSDVPGLGIVLTGLVVWLAGVLASNVLGRRLIGQGDTFISRIPIIGSIYGPVKQFTETVVNRRRDGFRQVVLAEYPTEGLWILGFATGDVKLDPTGKVGRCVFVPTSPNPATGWMVVFPPEKVRDTQLTIEEAMQLVVSAGIVVPAGLRDASAYGVSREMADELAPGHEGHGPPPSFPGPGDAHSGQAPP